jgi:hypothetical protein
MEGQSIEVQVTRLQEIPLSVSGAAQQIKQVVTSWSGVESHPHRFGGVEYRLGTREIGHMHGDNLVDIPFPKRVRDQLVAAGEAEPHHILPATGWISFYLRSEPDIDRAIALFRQSYEIALHQRDRRDAG